VYYVYEPLDESKFSDQAVKNRAQQIARNKCTAEADQAAMAQPLPASAPQTNVTVNTGSTVGGGFYGGVAEGMARAQALENQKQAQRIQAASLQSALQAREQLRQSTFVSCMNREGWVQKRLQN